jgi:hypothetical protein
LKQKGDVRMWYVLDDDFGRIMSGSDPVDAVRSEHEANDCGLSDSLEPETFQYKLLRVPPQLDEAVEEIWSTDGCGEEGGYAVLELMEGRDDIESYVVTCTFVAGELSITLT